jgi:H+-transporting ATPase
MSKVDIQYDIERVKVKNLLEKYKTNYKGLDSDEVHTRQKEYGRNELPEVEQNPFLKFLGYFIGPIPFMIEAAAILSLLVHHYSDFGIILVLLLLNTLVSFWHDHKADNAIEALKKKLALNARVLRDDKWQILPASELVYGDIIRIRLGDIVPADAQLLEKNELECDESSLTGESLPVTRGPLEKIFSGSMVTRGESTAVVTETGIHTYFGKTAKLVEETKSRSHFEQALINIGNYLMILAVFLVAIIVIVAMFRQENLMETLRFALVLTVASIPVALPAVLTVTMAVGAIYLAKKRTIVKKLAAIEELAGIDVLCSDKTGTLTQNKLTMADPLPAEGFSSMEVLQYGVLASREEDNDAIDNAIIVAAKKQSGINTELKKYRINQFIPFDPVVKRTEVNVIDSEGVSLKISKGAPQVIFDLLKNQNGFLGKYQEMVEHFAQMGYRMLAVAFQKNSQLWQLVGLIPLYDPPRDDSRKTISDAKKMGVAVKMVTGDNRSIAKQISQKLGLGTHIISAEKFTSPSEVELEEIVNKAEGFAEVFPEHKFSIVKIFQKLHHFVGMTGDGVNDAPALKRADCGIAVSGATDAAKSAASIVLTAPGISVIIDAIKESRRIFQRMNSYAIYRIAETIRVLFFITLSILVFKFYPVTAVMIVLLALLNDAPIMSIAGDNATYSQKPEKWNMRIVFGLGSILGLIGVVLSFLIFYIGQVFLRLPKDVLQSFIFLKLAIAGHLTIFLSRVKDHFWSSKPSKSLLWSAIITKVLATLFAVYGWFITPIGWKLALFIWGYALVAFFITDFLKVYLYKLLNTKNFEKKI